MECRSHQVAEEKAREGFGMIGTGDLYNNGFGGSRAIIISNGLSNEGNREGGWRSSVFWGDPSRLFVRVRPILPVGWSRRSGTGSVFGRWCSLDGIDVAGWITGWTDRGTTFWDTGFGQCDGERSAHKSEPSSSKSPLPRAAVVGRTQPRRGSLS